MGSPDGHDIEVGPQGQLKRKLKNRHMQMIAIGGSIGAGLFVGSGNALYSGGPASLVIGYIIIGIMLLFTVTSLGELATMYPVNGSFYNYSVRFIDPAWGFAMGWNYALNWLVVLPFELTAAGITIEYWTKDPVTGVVPDKYNVGIWITCFLLLVVLINVAGVRGYGEVEFVLGMIKVTAIVGFIILGIIINCGGVPTDTRGYIGGEYWRNPGAFQNGFAGFCSVFVVASFAFGGTELVGLAAAESDNPRKTIPKATKQVFWRIALFYVISLLIVGLIIPSDDPNLSFASGANSRYSPFVIAITTAGINGLPSVFNAVITISVISVANSCTYGSTRTIQALCENGMGPKWGAYVDKKGRPWVALLVSLGFGLLAYINEAPQGSTIFTWLLALSGLSNFFTWGSICLAHIRFRYAWTHVNGRSTDELPFASQFGVWGSYAGLSLNILCLIATFYTSLWPLGATPDAQVFFENYLAAPIVLLFYFGYKIVMRDWSMWVKLDTLDIDAGRRELDLKDEMDAERAAFRALPFPKRAWEWLC
jgi:amino acid transporter